MTLSTPARWALVAGLGTVSLVFAFLLASDLTPSLGHVPDVFHILGHLVIFGGIGWLLRPVIGMGFTILVVALVGLGLECAQGYAIGRFFINEALFDIGVDLVAGFLGVALTGSKEAAEDLGRWLHPALVAPAGLYAVGFSELGSRGLGLLFVAVVMACFSPAVLFWGAGIQLGWYASADVRDRRRRPPLFGLAVLCSGLLVGLVAWLWPGPLLAVAIGIFLSTLTVTLITIGGVKISGHVSGALLTGVAVAPWSTRGAGILLLCGLILSWARVRGRCHSPMEVGAAWILALLAGGLVRLI